MNLLNTLGIAGLVWSIVSLWLVSFAKDKEDVLSSVLIALIPAAFTFLALI